MHKENQPFDRDFGKLYYRFTGDVMEKIGISDAGELVEEYAGKINRIGAFTFAVVDNSGIVVAHIYRAPLPWQIRWIGTAGGMIVNAIPANDVNLRNGLTSH